MIPGLTIITIYDHPRDYPDKFVVRACYVKGLARSWGGCLLADTLEEARAMIPAGMSCFPRSPGDDPVIVECWM